MDIIQLNSFDEVLKAFNDVSVTFPKLSKSSQLSSYLQKIYTFGKVYTLVDRIAKKHIGICAIYINDEIKKIAYITLIGLLKEYRGQNLGTKLIKFCENEAKNNGMDFVKLEVKKNNSAVKFYEHNGYCIADEETEDSFFMIKRLY